MAAYEIGEHVVESLLNVTVAVPYLLEVVQTVYVIFLLNEGCDFEDGALEQVFVVLVDHEYPVFLLLLGHTEPINHAISSQNYLYTSMNCLPVCFSPGLTIFPLAFPMPK